MIQLIVGGLFFTALSTVYYLRRRRQELEDRQLQMFIEQLVWDPDDRRYVAGEKQEILPLKEQ